MLITISNPYKKNLLIKAGQKVDFDTPLANINSREQIKIFIAQKLGIAPKKIFAYLKKFVGDSIKKDEILAQKKTLLTQHTYKSQCDGIIKEVNHEEGIVIIDSISSKESIVHCFFKGEIVKTDMNTIELKVKNGTDFLLKQIVLPEGIYAMELGGSIVCVEKIDSTVNEECIQNKFVVIPQISSYEQAKIEALGAFGFITAHRLKEASYIPSALLKNASDIKAMQEHAYSNCIINRKESKIYVYE